MGKSSQLRSDRFPFQLIETHKGGATTHPTHNSPSCSPMSLEQPSQQPSQQQQRDEQKQPHQQSSSSNETVVCGQVTYRRPLSSKLVFYDVKSSSSDNQWWEVVVKAGTYGSAQDVKNLRAAGQETAAALCLLHDAPASDPAGTHCLHSLSYMLPPTPPLLLCVHMQVG